MRLEEKVNEKLKAAMKSKDKISLESLRLIKSEILLLKTKSGNSKLNEDDELRLIQKMIKQRKDSANIYDSKGRNDLATSELNQIKIISQFLPKQLEESDIVDIVDKIIVDLNASGMKDMGKVMSLASQEMMGKADGKTISSIVKSKLSL
ncbi:MAG: glutamyl-tRNA amidotransferase [Flavobacteriales bacterium]|nr:glutamyl-tRNA amidotransferase [Flavobacteriales bacterium]